VIEIKYRNINIYIYGELASVGSRVQPSPYIIVIKMYNNDDNISNKKRDGRARRVVGHSIVTDDYYIIISMSSRVLKNYLLKESHSYRLILLLFITFWRYRRDRGASCSVDGRTCERHAMAVCVLVRVVFFYYLHYTGLIIIL